MRAWRRIIAGIGMTAGLLTACNGNAKASVIPDTSNQNETTKIELVTAKPDTTPEPSETGKNTQSTTESKSTKAQDIETGARNAAETTSEPESTTEAVSEPESEAETTTEEPSTTEAVTTQPETTTEAVTTTQPETTTEEVTTTQAPTMSAEEKAALLKQAVSQALPGIVCWGDSLTYGYGGNGESYPSTLQRLINERLVEGIPVVNNGVCVEQTYTIMARAGAWEMRTNQFIIPAQCWPTEIHIDFEGGMYTNLAAFGDAGLNPVTIDGVKGNITSSYHEGEHGYCYFTRLEPGEEVTVEAGTLVYPASKNLYGGYVNVIFMGENGYYENAEDLISQYQRIIDARVLTRYVIIGLTTGGNTSRGELSQKMAAYFGNNYIDMRTELVNRGPELVGLERETGDWYNIQEGLVMGYLKSDEIHLNEYGYRAVGMILYERMEALGYFDGVKNAIAQYGN